MRRLGKIAPRISIDSEIARAASLAVRFCKGCSRLSSLPRQNVQQAPDLIANEVFAFSTYRPENVSRLLDLVSSDRFPVAGMHLGEFGSAYIKRDGENYCVAYEE